jgi:hypothetical protein
MHRVPIFPVNRVLMNRMTACPRWEDLGVEEHVRRQLAAERMGTTQPKVSALLRREFSNLSERKLMDCLNRLGYDIEIKVRPATKRVGHLTLAIT